MKRRVGKQRWPWGCAIASALGKGCLHPCSSAAGSRQLTKVTDVAPHACMHTAQDPRYMATLLMDSSRVVILDIRSVGAVCPGYILCNVAVRHAYVLTAGAPCPDHTLLP